ncbi:hypothetical protein B296_00052480, partial [Ensete ventricosum]
FEGDRSPIKFTPSLEFVIAPSLVHRRTPRRTLFLIFIPSPTLAAAVAISSSTTGQPSTATSPPHLLPAAAASFLIFFSFLIYRWPPLLLTYFSLPQPRSSRSLLSRSPYHIPVGKP